MSNAAKHRKKAAEFEQLKQVDRAIALYIKAIDESEADGEDVDVALLNKVGDLTLRQGRVADAVTYYERAVEHYATAGLFNNAIALCNKILRSAPGRSNVYFTLGRICAKKGLRGDATRNFLEYATRMQQEGRINEGMRALAEVAVLMPELTEVRQMVEEHAARVGIELPRKMTPAASPAALPDRPFPGGERKSSELIFLDVGLSSGARRNTPPLSPRIPAPVAGLRPTSARQGAPETTPHRGTPATSRRDPAQIGPASLDAFLLFDPSRPGTPPREQRAVTPPVASQAIATVAIPVDEAAPVNDAAPVAVPVDVVPVIEVPEAAASADTVIEPILEPSEEPVGEALADRTMPDEVVSGAPVDDEPMTNHASPALEISGAFETSPEPSESTAPLVFDPVLVEAVIVEAPAEMVDAMVLDALVDVLPRSLDSVASDAPAANDEGTPAASIVDLVTGHIEWTSDDVPQLSAAGGDGVPVAMVDSGQEATDPLSRVDEWRVLEELESGDAIIAERLDDIIMDPTDEGGASVMVGDLSTAEVTSDVPSETLEGLEGPTDPDLWSTTDASNEASDSAPESALPDFMFEDFEHAVDDPNVRVATGSIAGTPAWGTLVPRVFTPLDVSRIPEIDAAIEAGARTAALADADPEIARQRPPFRIDPHNFILPGELPPLMLEDDLELAGLRAVEDDAVIEAHDTPDAVADTARHEAAALEEVPDHESIQEPERGAFAIDSQDGVATTVAILGDSSPATEAFDDVPCEAAAASLESMANAPSPSDTEAKGGGLGPAAGPELAEVSAPEIEAEIEAEIGAEVATALLAEVEAAEALRASIEAAPPQAAALTPAVPIAAVAAEASVVASSRRDELQDAVDRSPQDWALRRRLAEALFEVGARERGLSELQASLTGFSQGGQLDVAADISDELVRISPERIAYHQKRVELAVRLENEQRLREAYLDLADTLVRAGDEARAHAVYARVLELDPWDERAREALGAAAPPPPPQPSQDEEFVDLAEWLRDDEPASTRMRMRAPQVSGDEQVDFESLLRHFKEGVSRSLGEEDFESHYDLGVAYKEMGLLDDAIAEFQKALRSRRHRLPAYEALGQCFVEQSRHSVAATVLTRALHEPGMGDEHRVGVLYLLAYSCEALQRWDEARSYYSRVYATDIHFRDVAARLAALDPIAR